MQKRIEWIDMAKGIGIILVIMGHISFRPEVLNVWLCSFHMPLFFFLSGLTYNSTKYSKFKFFLTIKFKQLVIPYFILAFIMWLWKALQQVIGLFTDGELNVGYLVKQFFGIFLQVRTTLYGIGVWFIPCIFCAFIILFFIIKISKNNNVYTMLLSSACLIIGYLYAKLVNIKLPWGIDAALIAVFFMALGVVFKNIKAAELLVNLTKKSALLILAASLVLNVLFTYLNWRILKRTVGMWSNNYGNLAYFILAALFGIVIILCLSKIICIESICQIGNKSLFYYGVHTIILEAFSYGMRYVPRLDNFFIAFVCSILLIVLTTLILKAMYPYYNRLYNGVLEKVFK